jgi:hypothetical protein
MNRIESLVRALLIPLLVAGAACGKPHVNFAQLPPNLPPEHRVTTFNQLRGAAEQVEVQTTCRSGGGGCSTSVHRSMFLANGTHVNHPEDVLPLVDPASATAKHARAHQASARRSTAWGSAAPVIPGSAPASPASPPT